LFLGVLPVGVRRRSRASKPHVPSRSRAKSSDGLQLDDIEGDLDDDDLDEDDPDDE
jgi:hypothetical protein